MHSEKRLVKFLTYKPSGEVEYSYNDGEIEFLNHGNDKKYILLKKDSLKGSFYEVNSVIYKSLIEMMTKNEQKTNSERFKEISDEISRYVLGIK